MPVTSTKERRAYAQPYPKNTEELAMTISKNNPASRHTTIILGKTISIYLNKQNNNNREDAKTPE